MKMAKACGATRLKIFGDSNLVVQQVMNRCDTINDICYQQHDCSAMYESKNFGTKFSLRRGDYNIPGLEVIK
jgi:ribonuclease HI